MAELDCQDSEVKNAVNRIITEELEESFKFFLNAEKSSEINLCVSFTSQERWFEIPTFIIKSIEK